jgi:hypothetical protein
MKARIVLVGALFFLTAVVAIAAPDPQWAVTTDRSSYFLGEQVAFTVEVCNAGDEVAEVDINVGVGVLDAAGTSVWGSFTVPWVNMVSIPPGDCVIAVEIGWNQSNFGGNDVAPGFYRGEAMDSLSAPFEILDQPMPAVPLSMVVPMVLAGVLLASGALLLVIYRRG